ncbi:MAG: DUF4097 domain-containing protein [candidate division Zixibacteria bacterium]|nr:DUF4097 domain-containing protein [candidate division Zixibacteria bacterium]
MFKSRIFQISLICFLFAAAVAVQAERDVITKVFPAREMVKVNTISGDLVIVQAKGNEISVDIEYDIRPRGSFEPVFKERKSSLVMSEEFHGHSNSGRITWTVSVPEGTTVDFNTASGDMMVDGFSGEIRSSTASGDHDIRNFKGELEISTASGDFDIRNSEGIFDLSTASGNVEITNCRGEIDASSASGDIDISGVIFNEDCSFSSASGDVYVELAETPKHDLELSSASGNSVLNFNGHPIEGHFEFVAKYRHGDIESPIDFDDEETFRNPGDRERYVRKTFSRGDKPYISIRTATGEAVLEES